MFEQLILNYENDEHSREFESLKWFCGFDYQGGIGHGGGGCASLPGSHGKGSRIGVESGVHYYPHYNYLYFFNLLILIESFIESCIIQFWQFTF